jgi:LAO/AO transport system kinase
MKINLDELFQRNRRELAKSITLIESSSPKDFDSSRKLVESILPKSGKSIRIGITGIPGVGKSTFIEAFGLHAISLGKKVAVLAIDPSSPINGGSILGDKTRMDKLSAHQNAFIRPSPTSGSLGGVANKTRESILLCEAAGYDVVLVESVGVGQSEYELASMVDFFLVLMQPGAGDELQGIKRGILEVADMLVINKADGDNITLASQTKSHYESAMHLLASGNKSQTNVLTCSSLENKNIDSIWKNINKSNNSSDNFLDKRKDQNKNWMSSLFQQLIQEKIKSNDNLNKKWKELEDQVVNQNLSPMSAASLIIKDFNI